MPHDDDRWWRGRRGEWLVAVQVVLMALVFLGPRTVDGWPPWPFPFPHACFKVGAALILSGGACFLGGLFALGPGLTPLPYPKDGAVLIETGLYAIVRHPIYAGALAASFGWALMVQGWLTLGYAAALAVLFDVKSRQEERWLTERFPAYRAYQRRVRKLVPFVY